MEKISKEELKQLILDGISSEELKSRYVYSDVTDMSYMFYDCSGLVSVPELDTSNVTDMSYMFYGCSKLESVPELDTSNVTSMSWMFYGCKKLKNVNPYNFHLFIFAEIENESIKLNFPELYI